MNKAEIDNTPQQFEALADHGSCKNCGGAMIGDGHTTARHCEFADADGYEADAAPIYCEGDV